MLGDPIGAGESSYTQYDREVAARAVEWTRDAGTRPDEPFVLYVGFLAPHFPLLAPQAFFDLVLLYLWPTPKLHPDQGCRRHPWVQDDADVMPNEDQFRSPQERLQAFAAYYYGLCSFLDHHVGRVVQALADAGLADSTTLDCTSGQGDNLGTRGLWGKSTLYQERVRVPMVAAAPGLTPAVCETPVDLLDLFPTLLAAAGVDPAPEMDGRPGRSLLDIAAAPPQRDRAIFSAYHAAGSNTDAFMLRKGRWTGSWVGEMPPSAGSQTRWRAAPVDRPVAVEDQAPPLAEADPGDLSHLADAGCGSAMRLRRCVMSMLRCLRNPCALSARKPAA